MKAPDPHKGGLYIWASQIKFGRPLVNSILRRETYVRSSRLAYLDFLSGRLSCLPVCSICTSITCGCLQQCHISCCSSGDYDELPIPWNGQCCCHAFHHAGKPS